MIRVARCLRAVVGVQLLHLAASSACIADDDVSSCEVRSSELDDTSLLQQKQRHRQKLRREVQGEEALQSSRRSAIAYAGGGFLSLADFSGATSGLLHALRKKDSRADLTQLFQKYGTFSGISGGSWFTQMLMFSSSFLSLVEKGADFPNHAGMIHNLEFALPWLLTLPSRRKNRLQCSQDVSVLVKSLLEGRMSLMDGTAAGLLERGQDPLAKLTGNFTDDLDAAINRVERQVEDLPADFDSLKQKFKNDLETLKGSELLDIGKTLQEVASQASSSALPEFPISPLLSQELLVALGLLLTTGGISWVDFTAHLFKAGAGVDPERRFGTSEYNAWARNKLNLVVTSIVTPPGTDSFTGLPTRDHVTLYSRKHSRLAFTAADGTFNWEQPAYFSTVVGRGEGQSSTYPFCRSPQCKEYATQWLQNGSPVGRPGNLRKRFNRAFETDAGQLPISMASAASSAFLGFPALDLDMSATDCIVPSVWTTDVGEGRSFQAADALRSKVFSAATLDDEVVAEVTNLSPMPLIDGGTTDDTGIVSAVGIGASEVLAFLDNKFARVPSLYRLFDRPDSELTAIFKSPAHDTIETIYENLSRIPARAGSKFLQSIAYGTIDCVTKKNVFFGIPEGRRVKLRLFAIETSHITIGYPTPATRHNSFFSYGDLVTEITQAMAASPQTDTILADFF